ncbi:hypothetical protein Plec18167_006180 [Paecilomyces lecythidis]|uniref:Uncharacterized protein n=1 Tax=Paecilomyces lecythidis TaxID=3004212 RepID=A0ABR3XCH6_9EURO
MKFATVFGAVALCAAPAFSSVLVPTGTVNNYTVVPSGAAPAHLSARNLQNETVSTLFARNLQNETVSTIPKLGNFGFKRTPVRQTRRFDA